MAKEIVDFPNLKMMGFPGLSHPKMVVFQDFPNKQWWFSIGFPVRNPLTFPRQLLLTDLQATTTTVVKSDASTELEERSRGASSREVMSSWCSGNYIALLLSTHGWDFLHRYP